MADFSKRPIARKVDRAAHELLYGPEEIHLSEELDQIRGYIVDGIVEKYESRHSCFVCGSYETEYFNDKSDIDINLALEKDYIEEFGIEINKARSKIERKMKKQFGRKVCIWLKDIDKYNSIDSYESGMAGLSHGVDNYAGNASKYVLNHEVDTSILLSGEDVFRNIRDDPLLRVGDPLLAHQLYTVSTKPLSEGVFLRRSPIFGKALLRCQAALDMSQTGEIITDYQEVLDRSHRFFGTTHNNFYDLLELALEAKRNNKRFSWGNQQLLMDAWDFVNFSKNNILGMIEEQGLIYDEQHEKNLEHYFIITGQDFNNTLGKSLEKKEDSENKEKYVYNNIQFVDFYLSEFLALAKRGELNNEELKQMIEYVDQNVYTEDRCVLPKDILTRARLKMAQGKYDDAAEIFENLDIESFGKQYESVVPSEIQRRSFVSNVYKDKAVSNLESDKPREAKNEILKALEFNPRDVSSWRYLLRAAESMGDDNENEIRCVLEFLNNPTEVTNLNRRRALCVDDSYYNTFLTFLKNDYLEKTNNEKKYWKREKSIIEERIEKNIDRSTSIHTSHKYVNSIGKIYETELYLINNILEMINVGISISDFPEAYSPFIQEHYIPLRNDIRKQIWNCDIVKRNLDREVMSVMQNIISDNNIETHEKNKRLVEAGFRPLRGGDKNESRS